MPSEILLTIGGLLLSVATFFGGVWWTNRRHAKEDRQARILRVVDRYMEFRRSNFTSGLDGLQRSGIAMLSSNEEVREVARLIMAHGEPNPLGSNEENLLKDVDLLILFKFAAATRHNFLMGRLEDLIQNSSARK